MISNLRKNIATAIRIANRAMDCGRLTEVIASSGLVNGEDATKLAAMVDDYVRSGEW